MAEEPERATKGERTRSAILGAAVRQLAVSGLRGTSVPSIAREVGLTPSAVYAYFPTKQHLFDAAVDADAAGLVAEALPELLDGRFDGDFTKVFTHLLSGLEHHPLARRVIARAERTAVLPSEVRLQSGLAKALRAGQAEGKIRADIDPELLATGLEAVVISLLTTILQTSDEPDPSYVPGVLAVLDATIRPPV